MQKKRLRLLATSVAIALFAIAGTFAGAVPANAVTPGSVTAVINNTAGNSGWSAHGNTTGWSKGTIDVSFTLYIGASKAGPFTEIDHDSVTCKSTTSCSTVTMSGSCSDGWYKGVATASGPGGTAENSPSTRIVHVYGGTSARANGTAAVSPAYAASCKTVYEPI